MDILIIINDFRTLMDIVIIGFDSYWYGAMNIDDDITCNNDDYLGEDTTICWVNTRRWFHALYYWDERYFHFCFDPFFTACAHTTIVCHQWPSLILSNACFLLSIVHVHNLVMCASHNDYSTGYHIWLGSSSHPHVIACAPLSLTNLW
jgi:hypothetical protein